MNCYELRFFANCPANGVRIEYTLQIETREVLRVEELITSVESIDDGWHEELADELSKRWGGVQRMTADHHGVRITTTRGKM